MSITIKKFDKGDFNKKRNTNRLNHPIAVFLRNNPRFAFTIKEVTKRVKMNEDTVRSMLRKLKQDRLVTHKSPYVVWTTYVKAKRK